MASASGFSMRTSFSKYHAIFFLFALFSQFAFAEGAGIFSSSPEHSAVLEHNRIIATSLSHSPLSPPNGTNSSVPSYDHPIGFAYVKLLSAMPSVDTRISSNHPPEILWTWGQSHGSYLEKLVPGCRQGVYRLTVSGKPKFDGSIVLSAGGKSQALAPSEALIATPDEILRNLSISKGENSSPVFPTLNISISGKVKVPYIRKKTVCRMVREAVGAPGKGVTGSGEVCRCDDLPLENVTIESDLLSDQKLYEVEVGTPFFTKLIPIAGEQLSYRPQAVVALLSSRMPAALSLSLDGKELNSTHRSEFSTVQGEFGEWNVVSREVDYFSSSPGLSNLSAPLEFSTSKKYLNATALDGSAFPHAYQMLLSTRTQLPNGASVLSASFTDHFNDKYSSSWKILTRDLAIIENENGSVQAFAINSSLAKRKFTASAKSDIYAEQYFISGSDFLRPALAVFPKWGEKQFFDFAAIPFVGLAALFWAYFSFRQPAQHH